MNMHEQEIPLTDPLESITYVDESPIHGTGLFARIQIEEAAHIGTYEGPAVDYEGTYVLWVYEDDGSLLARDGENLLRYLNHSREPNAYFDGFDLYAERTICPGEEITFNYTGEEGSDLAFDTDED
jgi:SET domain-containing protein